MPQQECPARFAAALLDVLTMPPPLPASKDVAGGRARRAGSAPGRLAVIHADVLGERARLTPDKTALVWVPDGSRYTYRDLDERAGRVAAAWLDACGFAPGDRVGLLAHNRVEFIDAFFAAAQVRRSSSCRSARG